MKRFRYYFLVFVVSLFPLWSLLFASDLPHTHDGFVHLVRIAAYAKAFTNGQILPRWAGDLNYGYGMPLFNFIYHIPYVIASLFVFTGVSLVQSFKLTLALSFLLSGIFMYAFALDFFKDEKKALLVAIFYQFAPFRLVELLIRGSFGEVYAYTFLPLILYGLSRLRRNISLVNITITAVAGAFLILSHNSVSLVFFIFSVAFFLFFSSSAYHIFWSIISVVLALALSAFYWIPAMLEHKYTLGDLYMKDLYLTHFPPLLNFFLPYRANIPHLQTGGVPVQLGLFHIIAIFLCIYTLFTYKKLDAVSKKIYIFCMSVIGVSIFFMQPASTLIWKNISFLRQFQFPWRFLSVTTVTTSLLSIVFTHYMEHKKAVLFAILLTLTIASSVSLWNPPLGFDRIRDESGYWNYPLTSTYFGETDVIWSAGPAKAYPKNRFEIIEGDASIVSSQRLQTKHNLEINAKTQARVVDHTQYFPGWRVMVDGNKTPIEFQDQLWRGLITFRVPSGIHNVKIAYEKSKIQVISEAISLSVFVGIAIFSIIPKKYI